MKLISDSHVLLQDKEYKPKAKKGEPEPSQDNPEILWEAEVVMSLSKDLKKGDRVVYNRLGNLPFKFGKKECILAHVEDVIAKL